MNTLRRMRVGLVSLLFTLGWAAPQKAAEPPEPTLRIGDPAPALSTGRWIQGEPVREFQRTEVYLLEFWATWCGPCREAIPHLNELHLKYRDRGLVVIGQDVLEDGSAKVEPFIKKMGRKMTYRVALDDAAPSGSMAKNWLLVSGQQGIPSAIIVGKDGRIAWIGYAANLQEPVIEAILDGTFDVAKAATRAAAERKLEKDVDAAAATGDWDSVLARLEEFRGALTPVDWEAGMGISYALTRFQALVSKEDSAGAQQFARVISEQHPTSVGLNAALAFRILETPKLEQRDLDLAEKLANRAYKTSRGTNAIAVSALTRALKAQGRKDSALKIQERALKQTTDPEAKARLEAVIASSRFELAVDKKDSASAHRVAREFVEHHYEDGMLVNEYAWRLLTVPGLEPRDAALAEKWAAHANDLTQGESPAILDTLALAQFDTGKPQVAIQTQEKAIASATGNALLQSQLLTRLESYRAGKRPEKFE